MKKCILIAGLITALLGTTLFPLSALAAYGTTGWTKVEYVAGNDSSESMNWFMLAGIASASTCPTSTVFGTAKVLFAVKNDEQGKQQMAVLEAAMLSGRSVNVTYDPTRKNTPGTMCLALSIYLK